MTHLRNILYLFIFLSYTIFSQTSSDSSTTVHHKFRPFISLTGGRTSSIIKTNDLSSTIYKDSLSGVQNMSSFGFQMGGGFETDINKRLLLRVKLIPSAETINLIYKKTTGDEELQLLFFGLNLPIHFLATTKGENFKTYIGGGPSFNFGFGADKATKDKFNPKQFDILIELGIGCIKKLKQVSLNPEIRISQGLTNINGSNKTLYTQSLNKMYRQNIWLTLNIIAN